jgi:hypothetical protein
LFHPETFLGRSTRSEGALPDSIIISGREKLSNRRSVGRKKVG